MQSIFLTKYDKHYIVHKNMFIPQVNEVPISDPDREIEDEQKRMWNPPIEAHIHLADGDVWPIHAARFVIAAGAESGHVANLAGIGAGDDMLHIPCPVEPRKRYVYVVHAPEGPSLDCPMVIDPSGNLPKCSKNYEQ